MKTLASLVIVALAAAAASAQNYTEEARKARNAPDLFVLGAGAHGPDRNGEATYTIVVRNTGQKKITAVDWEYSPPGAASPTRFRNADASISPGARVKVFKRIAYPGDELVRQFRLNAIRIMRVEYEDGTSWERPSDGG